MRRNFTVALIVAAVLAGGYLGVRWLVSEIHRNSECGYMPASVCQGLRESDERECHAGEGCGTPLNPRASRQTTP